MKYRNEQGQYAKVYSLKSLFLAALVGMAIGSVAITIIQKAFEIPEYEAPISPAPSIRHAMEAYALQPNILYEGKASYYSHDGCIGCSEDQIMGNGKPFDENANTLAIPCEDTVYLGGQYRYGTEVKVINNDTADSEYATITDCGGFSKYGRVADLSKGLAERLNVKTDISNVIILEE